MIYHQASLNLSNYATILINTPNTLSSYEFELLTNDLKNTYRFTSFNISKTPNLSELSKLLTSLNPHISLISKIRLLTKYYLLKKILTFTNYYHFDYQMNTQYLTQKSLFAIIKTFYKHNKIINKSSSTIIYNPTNIFLSSDIIPHPYHYLNYPVKLKKLKKYKNIHFIFEINNPESLVIYYELYQYCRQYHCNLIIHQY